MKGHELVNRTLVRDDHGITARCECGWSSVGHFTSFAASAAHAEHQEKILERLASGEAQP